MGFIYKITNLANGKCYIGQTTRTVESRWSSHISIVGTNQVGCAKLKNAMEYYGIDNFAIQTIEECDNSKLDNREKYWINYYDSVNMGYNIELGGVRGQKKENNYREIADKYLELKSLRKTAKEMGCTVGKVQKAIRSFGIDAKEVGYQDNSGPRKKRLDYKAIVDDYLKTFSVEKTAKNLGVSPQGARNAIMEETGKTLTELRIEHGLSDPFEQHKKNLAEWE